jgi:hypothetical protein
MPAPTGLFRFLFLIFAAVLLLVSATQLYRFSQERADSWWTPRGMSVPLEAGHHRVRVYLRGKELDELVARRQLLLQDESGTRVVTRTDVGLRFNNWDRVRAERIPSLLIYGFIVGAAAALLLSGVIMTLVGRRSG